MFVADLHLHSNASDGELEPDQLVDLAAAAHLEAIALTDHDCIAGIPAAARRARDLGITLVSGTELTAYAQNQELHILGLFVDTREQAPLKSWLDRMSAARPERLLAMASKLRKLGVALSDEEAMAAARGSRSPGRAHLARALIQKGIVPDMATAFRCFLNPTAPAYVAKPLVAPAEVIECIHQSSGIAILAHPGQYHDDDLVRALLPQLDGLEASHHSHSPEDTAKYKRMARDQHKSLSGGSDFHGSRMKPGIRLGMYGLEAEEWRELNNRITFHA